jgi:hypothetical protein
MPIAPADWTVTRSTGAIRYVGQDHATFGSPANVASYATVIELHRFLQDLADDEEFSGDDQVDITVRTPSDRSTDNIITLINGFNIDDGASEHLYDGSIIQSGGNTVYDGIVNFGNQGVRIQIIQNGAVLADDWWNLAGPGSPNQNVGLNADANAGISHRFMLKVRDGGVDIDGRRLLGTTRTFGNTYGEFSINGTNNGNNVLALSDSTDLNNSTSVATVATWDDVVNQSEGYTLIDVEADAVPEDFYSRWTYGTRTVNQFYERLKYLTKDTTVFGSPTTYLYGLPGELFRGITHELDVDNVSGPWTSTYGLAEWGSPRTGTGQVLAFGGIASGSPITKVWIQLLTGVIPINDQFIEFKGNAGGSPQTGFGSPGGGSAQLNLTVTERTVSTPFVGQSTGSALIGAYGLGVLASDLTAADTVFDLTNTAVNPPNNVTFSVSGLEIGEDRVLVVPSQGAPGTAVVADGIDKNQLTLATTLSGTNETSAVTTTPIPTDSPGSGTIRITTDSGLERYIVYSSFTGSTFTIGGPGSPANGYDFSGDNATVAGSPRPGVYISYIDKLATAGTESFTVVYSADRALFIRVRDGGTAGDFEGIQTFETVGTISSTGGSTSAIRTPDA